ncbi:syntaxin-18-like [Styela clava]
MHINFMDRTNDFKKAIRDIRKENSILDNTVLKKPSLDLHAYKRRKSDFNKKANDIVQSISKLRDFLLQHRIAYINSHQAVGLASQPMSDHERDKIDEEAQNIIKKCNDAITVMQQNVEQDNISDQQCTHRQLVLASIQNHLKSVCKIYSEQRAIRVKLVVDKKRISRLHNPETHKKALTQDPDHSNNTERPAIKFESKFNYEESDEDDFSETEAAALEQENVLLFNDMNSMVDEVRAIEGKVVEITRLQEIFSEQVLQQEGDIEIISEKVIESTENIKGGNEELREAIKNNAGFRVWILIFLLMCSFSLLFLEWYS